MVIYGLNWYLAKGEGWYDVKWLLYEMAKGWAAQDVYTSFVIWVIWWPAWAISEFVLLSGFVRSVEQA